MKKIKLFLFFVLCLVLVTSCKPKEIIVREIQYRDRLQIDSVVQTKYDSIRITTKGDTVFIEKYKVWFQDRIKLRTDTVLKFVEKPVPVEKIVEVERNLTTWQKLTIASGKLFILLLSIGLLYLIVKLYLKYK